jgi:hypothetical protein
MGPWMSLTLRLQAVALCLALSISTVSAAGKPGSHRSGGVHKGCVYPDSMWERACSGRRSDDDGGSACGDVGRAAAISSRSV